MNAPLWASLRSASRRISRCSASADRPWLAGEDYTIADVATLGWVRNLIGFYEAREIVAFDKLKNVPAWLERGLARPAVQRGLNIPARA